MFRPILFIGFLLSYYASQAQEQFMPDTLATVNPWTHLSTKATDTTFQFAVIADLTGGYRYNIFPAAVEKINLVMPDFVMSVGDLIEGYVEDSAQILGWWDQFDGWVSDLQVPFFYVPGNHDLSNSLMTDLWEKRYGRTYYHFVHKNILFLVINTEDGQPSHISSEQVNYFKKVLATNEAVDWTLLFFHKPLWESTNAGWSALEQLLKDRPYTVFAGHRHTYQKSKRFDRNYYVLGTTGGGSSLAGPEFGSFDHIAWITMSSSGPKVANLMLDGILHDSVQTLRTRPVADGLLQSTSFFHTPIFGSMVKNDLVQTTLHFENKGVEPLVLSGRFFQHELFRLSESQLDTILQPKESIDWPIMIATPPGLDLSRTAPIIFEWKMQNSWNEQILEK